MANSAIEIVSITTGRGSYLIGPASAFGSNTRDLVIRERPRIQSILVQFVSQPGTVDRLRPHMRRWGLGQSHSVLNEREWMREALLKAISGGQLLISVAPDVTRGFSVPHAVIVRKTTSAARAQALVTQPHLPVDLDDRLIIVIQMVPDYMSGATRAAFVRTLEDVGVGMIVGGLMAWIGAHFIPGINIAMLAFDLFFLGSDVLRACETIGIQIDNVRRAKNREDLKPIAAVVAGAIALLIVTGVFNRLLRAKSAPKAPAKKTTHAIHEKPDMGKRPAPKREARRPKDDAPVASKPSTGGDKPTLKDKPTLDDMYAKAPAAKKEIDEIADEIAAMTNGKVAKADLKGRARAQEKLDKYYDGDASRLKDLARNTIVVEADQYDEVLAKLRERGAMVKNTKPGDNALGYSGANAFVKTKAGIVAEIQVNTPEMIYANLKPDAARKTLGDKKYDELASRNIPGGKGHEFYEQSRSMEPHDPRQKEIAKQSTAYYDSIRKGGR